MAKKKETKPAVVANAEVVENPATGALVEAIKAGQEVPIQHQVFSIEDNNSKYRPLTTPERQQAQRIFLETYPQTARIDLACKAAGITTRTFYRWLQFPEFRQRFELARQSVVHMAESRLAQIAFSNHKIANGLAFSAVMAILNAEAAEKYRPRQTHDVNINIRDYRGFGK